MVYIAKKQLLTRIKRYKALNKVRMQNAVSLLGYEARLCLSIVPVLLHYNHVSLVGFRQNAPCGIDNFIPNPDQARYLNNVVPSVDSLTLPERNAILALYAMGSTSSIGQGVSSDLDLWVCTRAGLNAEELSLLQDKCHLISAYFKARGVELNLFVTPQDRFTNFQPDSLDEENCGSAQNFFLLDEFYRSSFRICGRYILWYLISSEEEEYDYQAYSKFLLKGITGISQNELDPSTVPVRREPIFTDSSHRSAHDRAKRSGKGTSNSSLAGGNAGYGAYTGLPSEQGQATSGNSTASQRGGNVASHAGSGVMGAHSATTANSMHQSDNVHNSGVLQLDHSANSVPLHITSPHQAANSQDLGALHGVDLDSETAPSTLALLHTGPVHASELPDPSGELLELYHPIDWQTWAHLHHEKLNATPATAQANHIDSLATSASSAEDMANFATNTELSPDALGQVADTSTNGNGVESATSNVVSTDNTSETLSSGLGYGSGSEQSVAYSHQAIGGSTGDRCVSNTDGSSERDNSSAIEYIGSSTTKSHNPSNLASPCLVQEQLAPKEQDKSQLQGISQLQGQDKPLDTTVTSNSHGTSKLACSDLNGQDLSQLNTLDSIATVATSIEVSSGNKSSNSSSLSSRSNSEQTSFTEHTTYREQPELHSPDVQVSSAHSKSHTSFYEQDFSSSSNSSDWIGNGEQVHADLSFVDADSTSQPQIDHSLGSATCVLETTSHKSSSSGAGAVSALSSSPLSLANTLQTNTSASAQPNVACDTVELEDTTATANNISSCDNQHNYVVSSVGSHTSNHGLLSLNQAVEVDTSSNVTTSPAQTPSLVSIPSPVVASASSTAAKAESLGNDKQDSSKLFNFGGLDREAYEQTRIELTELYQAEDLYLRHGLGLELGLAESGRGAEDSLAASATNAKHSKGTAYLAHPVAISALEPSSPYGKMQVNLGNTALDLKAVTTVNIEEYNFKVAYSAPVGFTDSEDSEQANLPHRGTTTTKTNTSTATRAQARSHSAHQGHLETKAPVTHAYTIAGSLRDYAAFKTAHNHAYAPNAILSATNSTHYFSGGVPTSAVGQDTNAISPVNAVSAVDTTLAAFEPVLVKTQGGEQGRKVNTTTAGTTLNTHTQSLGEKSDTTLVSAKSHDMSALNAVSVATAEVARSEQTLDHTCIGGIEINGETCKTRDSCSTVPANTQKTTGLAKATLVCNEDLFGGKVRHGLSLDQLDFDSVYLGKHYLSGEVANSNSLLNSLAGLIGGPKLQHKLLTSHWFKLWTEFSTPFTYGAPLQHDQAIELTWPVSFVQVGEHSLYQQCMGRFMLDPCSVVSVTSALGSGSSSGKVQSLDLHSAYPCALYTVLSSLDVSALGFEFTWWQGGSLETVDDLALEQQGGTIAYSHSTYSVSSSSMQIEEQLQEQAKRQAKAKKHAALQSRRHTHGLSYSKDSDGDLTAQSSQISGSGATAATRTPRVITLKELNSPDAINLEDFEETDSARSGTANDDGAGHNKVSAKPKKPNPYQEKEDRIIRAHNKLLNHSMFSRFRGGQGINAAVTVIRHKKDYDAEYNSEVESDSFYNNVDHNAQVQDSMGQEGQHHASTGEALSTRHGKSSSGFATSDNNNSGAHRSGVSTHTVESNGQGHRAGQGASSSRRSSQSDEQYKNATETYRGQSVIVFGSKLSQSRRFEEEESLDDLDIQSNPADEVTKSLIYAETQHTEAERCRMHASGLKAAYEGSFAPIPLWQLGGMHCASTAQTVLDPELGYAVISQQLLPVFISVNTPLQEYHKTILEGGLLLGDEPLKPSMSSGVFEPQFVTHGSIAQRSLSVMLSENDPAIELVGFMALHPSARNSEKQEPKYGLEALVEVSGSPSEAYAVSSWHLHHTTVQVADSLSHATQDQPASTNTALQSSEARIEQARTVHQSALLSSQHSALSPTIQVTIQSASSSSSGETVGSIDAMSTMGCTSAPTSWSSVTTTTNTKTQSQTQDQTQAGEVIGTNTGAVSSANASISSQGLGKESLSGVYVDVAQSVQDELATLASLEALGILSSSGDSGNLDRVYASRGASTEDKTKTGTEGSFLSAVSNAQLPYQVALQAQRLLQAQARNLSYSTAILDERDAVWGQLGNDFWEGTWTSQINAGVWQNLRNINALDGGYTGLFAGVAQYRDNPVQRAFNQALLGDSWNKVHPLEFGAVVTSAAASHLAVAQSWAEGNGLYHAAMHLSHMVVPKNGNRINHKIWLNGEVLSDKNAALPDDTSYLDSSSGSNNPSFGHNVVKAIGKLLALTSDQFSKTGEVESAAAIMTPYMVEERFHLASYEEVVKNRDLFSALYSQHTQQLLATQRSQVDSGSGSGDGQGQNAKSKRGLSFSFGSKKGDENAASLGLRLVEAIGATPSPFMHSMMDFGTYNSFQESGSKEHEDYISEIKIGNQGVSLEASSTASSAPSLTVSSTEASASTLSQPQNLAVSPAQVTQAVVVNNTVDSDEQDNEGENEEVYEEIFDEQEGLGYKRGTEIGMESEIDLLEHVNPYMRCQDDVDRGISCGMYVNHLYDVSLFDDDENEIDQSLIRVERMDDGTLMFSYKKEDRMAANLSQVEVAKAVAQAQGLPLSNELLQSITDLFGGPSTAFNSSLFFGGEQGKSGKLGKAGQQNKTDSSLFYQAVSQVEYAGGTVDDDAFELAPEVMAQVVTDPFAGDFLSDLPELGLSSTSVYHRHRHHNSQQQNNGIEGSDSKEGVTEDHSSVATTNTMATIEATTIASDHNFMASPNSVLEANARASSSGYLDSHHSGRDSGWGNGNYSYIKPAPDSKRDVQNVTTVRDIYGNVTVVPSITDPDTPPRRKESRRKIKNVYSGIRRMSRKECIQAARNDHWQEFNAPLNEDEWFDFGSISRCSPAEYFGSGLWLLYKAIDSPFKVVLKIILMEAYASEYSQNKLLASELKDHMLTHDEYSLRLDSYFCMYARVSSYLLRNGDYARLDLLRKCFYLKIFMGINTNRPSSNLEYCRKRAMLNALIKSWGWDTDFVVDLEQVDFWKISQVRDLNREVYKALFTSYQALLRFSVKHGIEYAITSDDAGILSRKLYAAFDIYPGKILLMHKTFSNSLEEEHLTFIQSKESSLCRRGWYLFNTQPDDISLLNMKAIYVGSRLCEVVAWATLNGLLTSRTISYVTGSVNHVTPYKIKRLSGDIKRVLQPYLNRVDETGLQRTREMLRCLVLLNLDDDPTVDILNRRLEVDVGSSLCSGRLRACLVGSVDLVLVNSWGEVRSISFPSGEDGVVELVATVLRIIGNSMDLPDALEGEADGEGSDQVFGHGIFNFAKASKKLKELWSAIGELIPVKFGAKHGKADAFYSDLEHSVDNIVKPWDERDLHQNTTEYGSLSLQKDVSSLQVSSSGGASSGESNEYHSAQTSQATTTTQTMPNGQTKVGAGQVIERNITARENTSTTSQRVKDIRPRGVKLQALLQQDAKASPLTLALKAKEQQERDLAAQRESLAQVIKAKESTKTGANISTSLSNGQSVRAVPSKSQDNGAHTTTMQNTVSTKLNGQADFAHMQNQGSSMPQEQTTGLSSVQNQAKGVTLDQSQVTGQGQGQDTNPVQSCAQECLTSPNAVLNQEQNKAQTQDGGQCHNLNQVQGSGLAQEQESTQELQWPQGQQGQNLSYLQGTNGSGAQEDCSAQNWSHTGSYTVDNEYAKHSEIDNYRAHESNYGLDEGSYEARVVSNSSLGQRVASSYSAGLDNGDNTPSMAGSNSSLSSSSIANGAYGTSEASGLYGAGSANGAHAVGSASGLRDTYRAGIADSAVDYSAGLAPMQNEVNACSDGLAWSDNNDNSYDSGSSAGYAQGKSSMTELNAGYGQGSLNGNTGLTQNAFNSYTQNGYGHNGGLAQNESSANGYAQNGVYSGNGSLAQSKGSTNGHGQQEASARNESIAENETSVHSNGLNDRLAQSKSSANGYTQNGGYAQDDSLAQNGSYGHNGYGQDKSQGQGDNQTRHHAYRQAGSYVQSEQYELDSQRAREGMNGLSTQFSKAYADNNGDSGRDQSEQYGQGDVYASENGEQAEQPKTHRRRHGRKHGEPIHRITQVNMTSRIASAQSKPEEHRKIDTESIINSIEVCCYSAAYSDAIKYDMRMTLRQVIGCLSSRNSSEYSFDVGKNTYIAKTDGRRGVRIDCKRVFASEEFDMRVLSRYGMRPEFSMQVPAVVDRYATVGIVQYFFSWVADRTWNIYIINERNEVSIYKNFVGSRASLVNAINRFYTTETQIGEHDIGHFNLPQYFVISRDQTSLHPFTIRNLDEIIMDPDDEDYDGYFDDYDDYDEDEYYNDDVDKFDGEDNSPEARVLTS